MNREEIIPIIENILQKHEDLAAPISEESLNMKYEDAYQAYQNGNFALSIRHFECICFQDPYQPVYWEGLASAQFMQKEYALSIQSWAMVCLLDPENAKGHLYAAECYFSLNNPKEGLKALAEAKKRCNEESFISRINLLEKVWAA